MLTERGKTSNTVFQISLLCFAVFVLIIPAQAAKMEQENEPAVIETAKEIENATAKPEKRLTPAGITRLDEITVTAKRHEEKIFDVPYTAHVVNSDDILFQKSIKTIPEVFREETGVMIQKTSHGQGSPFIRGFTGFHNVLLIDGIRLNNSTFREGPNQYWNTIDPYSIRKVELIKGPGSVMYGSDSIGGTVNAITKSPQRYGKGLLYNANIYNRYATGEKSYIGRMELSASYDNKVGIITGYTFKDFGDFVSGDGLLRNTGYDESDGDFKLEYFLDKDKKFIFAFQNVNQEDVPRTSKTTQSKSFRGTKIGSDIKRDLDQERTLSYIQFHWDKVSNVIERAKISLSYHNQRECRDRIKGSGSGEEVGFNVDTYGIWTQFESTSPVGHLTYGIDYYHDNVTSFKRNFNSAGMLTSVGIQGTVADDAAYDLFGVYIQDEISLGNFEFIVSARYIYAALDADKVEDPDTGKEICINENWTGLIGSVRMMYYANQHWNIFGGISQGFRAPNLSDMTMFQADSSFETPTTNLDSEKFITMEIGTKADFANWSAQLSYYYTYLDGMIVRSPTGAIIDGSPEVQKANIGYGNIDGVEAEASYSPCKNWTLFGNFTWVEGRSKQVEGGKKNYKPFDRMMPTTGRAGARWESDDSRLWAEAQTTIVDNQDDLSLRDRQIQAEFLQVVPQDIQFTH
ncbi:MAG: ferric enterobactin receptor FepA [Candidatus Scalindua brodae]|uniref:Ferric enterobactin receptor FepA n=1 Tax=Candidatus Scalindua brodae TaxID=237368 RepID=A0A0B0EKM9_9BACT|nr:MAG: ferric enterobactin receptor FepA [Candidatus Scalindua brodae]